MPGVPSLSPFSSTGRRLVASNNSFLDDQEGNFCMDVEAQGGPTARQLSVAHYSLSVGGLGCMTGKLTDPIGGEALMLSSPIAGLIGISSWNGYFLAIPGFASVVTAFSDSTSMAVTCGGIPASGLGTAFIIAGAGDEEIQRLCTDEFPDQGVGPQCAIAVDRYFDTCLSLFTRNHVQNLRNSGFQGFSQPLFVCVAAMFGIATVAYARSLMETLPCCPTAVTSFAFNMRQCASTCLGSRGTGYESSKMTCCPDAAPVVDRAPLSAAVLHSGSVSSEAAQWLRQAAARLDGDEPTGDVADSSHLGAHAGMGGGSPAAYGSSIPVVKEEPASELSPVTTPEHAPTSTTFSRLIGYIERGGDPHELVDPPLRVWLIGAVLMTACTLLITLFLVVDGTLADMQTQGLGGLSCGFEVISQLYQVCIPDQPWLRGSAMVTNSTAIGGHTHLSQVGPPCLSDLNEDPASSADIAVQLINFFVTVIGWFLSVTSVPCNWVHSAESGLIAAKNLLDTVQAAAGAIRTALAVFVAVTVIVAGFAAIRVVRQYRATMSWLITAGRDKHSILAATKAAGATHHESKLAAKRAGSLDKDVVGKLVDAVDSATTGARRGLQCLFDGLACDDTSIIPLKLPPTELGYLSDVPLEQFDPTLAGDVIGIATWSLFVASMFVGLLCGVVVLLFAFPGFFNQFIVPMLIAYVGFLINTELVRCCMRRCCVENRTSGPPNLVCGRTAGSPGYNGLVTAPKCFNDGDGLLIIAAIGRGPCNGFTRLGFMILGQILNVLSIDRPVHSAQGLDRAFLAWGGMIRGRIEAQIAARSKIARARQLKGPCLC